MRFRARSQRNKVKFRIATLSLVVLKSQTTVMSLAFAFLKQQFFKGTFSELRKALVSLFF